MDDAIKQRMAEALELKGLDVYEASLAAGLHRNYLWEALDGKRRKGSLDGFKKIAEAIGLDIGWLVTGAGNPFPAAGRSQSLEREDVLAALDTLIARGFGLDRSCARDAAICVLDILENPPGDSQAIDKLSRIRIGILGALRKYERPRTRSD